MESAQRVFLLTGSTGSIGGAIAKNLVAARNVHLVLAVRSAERGAAVAQSLAAAAAAAGSTVSVELVDLAKPASAIPAFAKHIEAKYKRLDVLVNNAATVPKTRTMLTLSGGQQVEMQFGVNVLAYVAMMKAFTPLLAASAQGGP